MKGNYAVFAICVVLAAGVGGGIGYELVNLVAAEAARTSCATSHVVKGVWM